MALDPKKWTTKTQEAVAEAGDLARSLANPQLTADHLLFAIASQEGTVAAALLSKRHHYGCSRRRSSCCLWTFRFW